MNSASAQRTRRLAQRIESLRAAFDRWVFGSAYLPTRGLALFRIFLAGGLLLLHTPDDHSFMTFNHIATFPESQFAPPFGPMIFFTGFADEAVFRAIEVIVTVGLVAVLVGWFARAAALTVVAALLLGWGMMYSGGKIDHASVALMLLLAMMSFTPWDRSLSVRALRERRSGNDGDALVRDEVEGDESGGRVASYQWIGAFLALVLGLAYLAAGIPKMLGGWLNPTSHAVHNLIDIYSFRNDNPGLLVSPLSGIDNGLFWEMFDIGATAWEVGFILTIFSLRTFRFAVATAVLFHMANALMLGIVYYPVLWFYALFLDWDRIHDSRPVQAFLALGDRVPARAGEWYVAGPAVLLAGVALYVAGSPVLALLDVLVPDLSVGFLMLTSASVVAAVYLVREVATLVRSRWSARVASRRERVPA